MFNQRKIQWLAACLLVALLSYIPLSSAQINFPALTGRVVDNASLLTSATRNELSQQLEQHEKETSNQVVIVTLKSLQGYSIETYGYQLGRHWGIGQKGKDNGVLLIVAPRERKVRIEVGYGLEGVLTDAYSHAIIQQDILPFFKKAKYQQGIVNGTYKILDTLKGSYKPDVKKHKSIKKYIAIGLFILLLLLFLIGLFGGTGTGGGRRRRRKDGSYDSIGYGGSWGGGSWGGGGFGGGGGSFGGGGASGGW